MADRPNVKWTGGEEFWTKRAPDIDLFMWRKGPKGKAQSGNASEFPILFVHGSSMGSQPTFDLTVPGRPYSSVMDWFAEKGFDTWCGDCEGYGRSSKHRNINFDIANGAEDLAAMSEFILRKTGAKKLLVYGISSGALKAALFAQNHPDRVERLAMDAFVWTGAGSPTLEQRKKRLNEWLSMNRRPIDQAFVRSIFERDHPDTADAATVAAFADAILTLDDSVPTGTYVDMCSRLPVVDPKKLPMACMIMRGEFDGIASYDDLADFFKELPNNDKQFTVMAGISHASFQQKNYLMCYHILHAFFTQPAPIYRADAH